MTTSTLNLPLEKIIAIHLDFIEFMRLGLKVSGFQNWENSSEKSSMERFQRSYGASPKTCVQKCGMIFDQQTTWSVALQVMQILCTSF